MIPAFLAKAASSRIGKQLRSRPTFEFDHRSFMCTCEPIPSLKLVGSFPALTQACAAFTNATSQPHVIQPKDACQNQRHLSVRQRLTNAIVPTYAESTKCRLCGSDRRFRRLLAIRISANDSSFWLEHKRIWVVKFVVMKSVMRNANVNTFREMMIVNSQATGENFARQKCADWGR